MPVISVIVPCFNEAANLPVLYDRLVNVAVELPAYDFEFLFVDDGSSDVTPDVLHGLHLRDKRVRALRFSRNFGSHAACLAGFIYGHGNYYVILAADLQDPPELISRMLRDIESGSDIVMAVRSQRNDPWLTVKLANIYHRLMRRCAIPQWPLTGADVVMIGKPVRDLLIRWKQKNSSLFAQILWSGFRQSSFEYEKQKRNLGVSKWTLRKKLKLFADSFVSFSFTPIRMISYAGMVFSAIGFSYAFFIVLNKIFLSRPIQGWSSIMVVLLLTSGFQFLTLGVIGEYLWRVADEVRGSPLFVVQSALGEHLPTEDVQPWSELFPTTEVEQVLEFKH